MATTGSISASPTRYGAHSSGYNVTTYIKNFINGSSWDTSGGTRTVFLYGFNFETLRELDNLKVEGFTISMSYTGDNDNNSCSIGLCNGFNTSTSSTDVSTYTDLGDGILAWKEGETSAITITATEQNFPNALTWINNNLESFLNGYTSNSFGIRITSHAIIKNLVFTVNYTYGNETFTVSTSVTPEGAGTVSPSSQEVESGATASVTATANEGYKFSHWQIDGADTAYTDSTLSGTITADILCTAVFEKLPPEFTAAEMIYSGNQISNSNKVIAGESFVISVGVI